MYIDGGAVLVPKMRDDDEEGTAAWIDGSNYDCSQGLLHVLGNAVNGLDKILLVLYSQYPCYSLPLKMIY